MVNYKKITEIFGDIKINTYICTQQIKRTCASLYSRHALLLSCEDAMHVALDK